MGSDLPEVPGRSSASPTRRRQGFVKIRQEAVRTRRRRARRDNDRIVLEDLVAAVLGIALLIYLAYALVRPERF